MTFAVPFFMKNSIFRHLFSPSRTPEPQPKIAYRSLLRSLPAALLTLDLKPLSSLGPQPRSPQPLALLDFGSLPFGPMSSPQTAVCSDRSSHTTARTVVTFFAYCNLPQLQYASATKSSSSAATLSEPTSPALICSHTHHPHLPSIRSHLP